MHQGNPYKRLIRGSTWQGMLWTWTQQEEYRIKLIQATYWCKRMSHKLKEHLSNWSDGAMASFHWELPYTSRWKLLLRTCKHQTRKSKRLIHTYITTIYCMYMISKFNFSPHHHHFFTLHLYCFVKLYPHSHLHSCHTFSMPLPPPQLHVHFTTPWPLWSTTDDWAKMAGNFVTIDNLLSISWLDGSQTNDHVTSVHKTPVHTYISTYVITYVCKYIQCICRGSDARRTRCIAQGAW